MSKSDKQNNSGASQKKEVQSEQILVSEPLYYLASRLRELDNYPLIEQAIAKSMGESLSVLSKSIEGKAPSSSNRLGVSDKILQLQETITKLRRQLQQTTKALEKQTLNTQEKEKIY